MRMCLCGEAIIKIVAPFVEGGLLNSVNKNKSNFHYAVIHQTCFDFN